MKKLKIIFLGTPDFAAGILDAILKNNFDVVAVVTVADKPAGRGQQLRVSAVKEFALAHNIPILQPTNLKSEDFLKELQSFKANLQVVVAFRMLPRAVWQMPEFGTFNLHASLLPDYRGAAPINWAIINGDAKTGVTTFFIDDKIDTGAMILSNETSILLADNAENLHDKLMKLGAVTVVETLNLIASDNAVTTIQAESTLSRTAHKLNKENCRIDWNLKGINIYNHVRGLSPYPTAWTVIKDHEKELIVKIEQVTFENETHNLDIGKIITTKKTIKVAVKDGFIALLLLQFPGKKKLSADALLNGMRFSETATMI